MASQNCYNISYLSWEVSQVIIPIRKVSTIKPFFCKSTKSADHYLSHSRLQTIFTILVNICPSISSLIVLGGHWYVSSPKRCINNLNAEILQIFIRHILTWSLHGIIKYGIHSLMQITRAMDKEQTNWQDFAPDWLSQGRFT